MIQTHRALRLSLTYLLAALLLVGMFGLALASSRDKSPVLPESGTLAELHSLGLLAVPTAANIDRIILLARLPAILIGLLLAALMCRWGRRVYGLWPGILTLTLVAFSPTILAYTQLAIGDLAGAALALAALYAWTRHLHRPTRRRAITAGVLAGLALAASYLTISLMVSLLIISLWHGLRRNPAGRPRAVWLLLPWLPFAVTLAVIIGLTSASPALSSLQALSAQVFITSPLRGTLLGIDSPGVWAYPLLLLFKMTLPELILLALAVVLIAMRGVRHYEWDFVIPVIVHLLLTPLLLPLLEVRYLLFVLPLIALFSSRAGAPTLPVFSWRRIIAAGVVVAAEIPVSFASFPSYLAFYNVIDGGSDNGYRISVGSNLDWGQDLPGLAAYLRQNHIDQVYLSYFGSADPADYGIEPTWLRSYPHSSQVDFPALAPPAGIYAISASNLLGIPSQAFPVDTYAWFLSHKPLAVIGHSIFVYSVPPDPAGPGTWAAVCASPNPVEQPGAIRQLAGMPQLPAFNFDCRQSLAVPQGPGWVVLPADVDPIADLGPADFISHSGTQIWKVSQPPAAPASAIASPQTLLPLPIADHLELLGYQVSAPTVQAGQTLVVTEWWRVRQPPPPPVSISARLERVDVAGNQQDVLSGDALGLRAEAWQPGLTLIQKHALTISPDLPPGDYWLAVGLLDMTTGRDFPISETPDQTIDRIVLRQITVTASSH